MFNFWTNRIINSAFKHRKKEHVLKNMESMRNVLILFSYHDWEDVSVVVQDLVQKGKNVVLWTVEPHKKDMGNTVLHPNVRVIGQKETSFLHILAAPVVREFESLSCDTLIDLTTARSRVIDYLLALNMSEFSIGISEPEQKVYDFIIFKDENKTLQEAYSQIKFYLNNVDPV